MLVVKHNSAELCRTYVVDANMTAQWCARNLQCLYNNTKPSRQPYVIVPCHAISDLPQWLNKLVFCPYSCCSSAEQWKFPAQKEKTKTASRHESVLLPTSFFFWTEDFRYYGLPTSPKILKTVISPKQGVRKRERVKITKSSYVLAQFKNCTWNTK